MRAVFAAIVFASSGCATGVGCLAGAGSGGLLGIIAAASEKGQQGVDTAQLMASGVVIGGICGCVAGLAASEQQKAADADKQAAEQKAAEAQQDAVKEAVAAELAKRQRPAPAPRPEPAPAHEDDDEATSSSPQ